MTRSAERIEFGGENWPERLGDLWCNVMHAQPMWPIHGRYECGVCGRYSPVPWAEHGDIHARSGLV